MPRGPCGPVAPAGPTGPSAPVGPAGPWRPVAPYVMSKTPLLPALLVTVRLKDPAGVLAGNVATICVLLNVLRVSAVPSKSTVGFVLAG